MFAPGLAEPVLSWFITDLVKLDPHDAPSDVPYEVISPKSAALPVVAIEKKSITCKFPGALFPATIIHLFPLT